MDRLAGIDVCRSAPLIALRGRIFFGAARAVLVLSLAIPALSPGISHAQRSSPFKKEWFGISDRQKMGLRYEAKSGPFTCYATSQATANRGVEVAMATYGRALEQFRTKRRIDKSVVCCIWDDEDEYHTYAALYNLSARGAFAFAARNILPNTDAIFGYVRKDFFEETLPHEVGHIILYNFADPSARTNPPAWLHEGFAQLMEGNMERSLEKARTRVAKAMDEDTYLPVWQLTSPKRIEAITAIYYAEALLFTQYLMNNQPKEDAFWGLCYYASRNRKKPFEHYFRDFYSQFKDIHDCDDQWQESILKDMKEEAGRKLRASVRDVAEGKACAAAGKAGDAIKHYRAAFNNLLPLLYDYDEATVGSDIVRQAADVMNNCAGPLQGLADRGTTVCVLPGAERSVVEKRVKGLVAEEGGEWLTDDIIGLTVRCDASGRVREVHVNKPEAGKVGGIAVGSTLTDLLILHGTFSAATQEEMQREFLGRAGGFLPDPDMNCFKEGSYPVVIPSGAFKGILVREMIDKHKEKWEEGDWFCVAPIPTVGVCCFDFDDDEITEIALYRLGDAARVFEERAKKGSRGILPRNEMMTLHIGDKREKLTAYLGEPDEQTQYVIPEISVADSEKKGMYRLKKKLKDEPGLLKLEYPGLEIIVWDENIISIAARLPSHAGIYAVRVGDPVEEVTRVLGSTKALMKYERKKKADELTQKEKYRGLFLTYAKGGNKISCKIDHEGTVSSIYAYATEWRGKNWGDTFYIR